MSVGILFRRIAAMLYDSLVVIATLMVATSLLLPFTHGQAIPADNYIYKLYLIFVMCGFYTCLWIYRGQTLGLLAWKLKIESLDGKPVQLQQALLRFILAFPSIGLFGLGLLWSVFDSDGLALHDRLSKTKIIYTSPRFTH